MGARSGGGGGGRSGGGAGGGGAVTSAISAKEINRLKAPSGTQTIEVKLKSDGTTGYAYFRKVGKQGQFVYGTKDAAGNTTIYISAYQKGAYGYTSVASTKSEAWEHVKHMFSVYAGNAKY